MTALKYSLDGFIHDMEGLLKEQPDQGKIFDKGSAWLERLIRDPGAIPAQFRVPFALQGEAPT